MRVAIVDDTPDMRLLVRRSLELDPDIEVVAEAADGRGAIDIAREHHPEVMLLDLAMPVMDGIQALPQVVSASPGTAVVVLSGFSATAMEARAMAAGARSFVQKGVPAAVLRDRVWAASGLPRPRREEQSELPAPRAPGVEESQAEAARLRAAISRTAHELRSPVTVILGLAETSLVGAELSPEQQEATRRALLRQAELLRRLASDLESATQAQRGVLSVEMQRVDVVRVVRETLSALAADEVQVYADPAVVAHADPSRLTQIVTNLVTNAQRYAEPPYEVHVVRAAEHVLVSVADRGEGVPESFRPRLFEEFTRARDDGRGTGLGLYVVRALAEAQGGEVEHQPRPDGGSIFTVRLRTG